MMRRKGRKRARKRKRRRRRKRRRSNFVHSAFPFIFGGGSFPLLESCVSIGITSHWIKSHRKRFVQSSPFVVL
jgi:hypothetical protein